MATRLLRLARSANEKHGLGSAQYSAMAVLYDRGPQSVLELARFERVAHPTMSRIVTSLEKAGFAQRVAVPEDRRTRHVQLTPQGRTSYEKVCANRVAVTAAILSQLKSETVTELLEVVERVSAMLEKQLPEN
jgi:DNA-binding MarR family transcriptional regulator